MVASAAPKSVERDDSHQTDPDYGLLRWESGKLPCRE